MKKINLIEWLSRNSHEKQKPQRFARYAAMLIILLTLGVGQMWATVTIYAVGNMQDNGGTWRDEKTTLNCHNWYSNNQTSTTWPGTSMTKWNDVSVDGHQVFKCDLYNDQNNKCIFNNGSWQTNDITNLTTAVKAYPYPTYLNGTWYYSPRVCKCLWESNQTVSGGYIYFDNSSASWANTYIYLVVGHGSYVGYYRIQQISNTKLWYCSQSGLTWSDAKYVALVGNNSSKSTGSGNPNNLTNCNHYSDALGYGLNTGSTYLISMSSGTNCTPISIDYKSDGYSAFNSTQTIKTAVKAAGGSYTDANSKATISITSYEMTGDGTVTQRTPSISTSAKSQTVSAARTATTTLSVGDVATGYQFDGWYTAATGGTKLSESTTYTYYPTSATTVYARFSEKTFTVTVTNDGNGTTSPNGAQTNKGQITGVAVSATPSEGYNFNNWTITSGTGSFADATDESTTFYPTGTATIRANFVSAATSTLTVTATAGGSITTPAAGYYSDITTTGYSIAASRSEGYKFTGWTKTAGDGAVSFSDASSLSTTATITTLGDVTVTAGFAAMSNSLSVSSSTLYAGDNITLTATKTNHTLDLTYQYKIGDGSWTDIATQSGTSKTWQIPYANTYQTYKFRVKSTDGSTSFYSAEQTVNVKGRIIIHVKNTNSWTNMYLYTWYNDGSDQKTNGNWGGTTGSGSNGQSCTKHATGSQWWDITITQINSYAAKFILNNGDGGSTAQNQTGNLSLSSFTHDAYYTMSTNASSNQTLSTTTTPAAPTVSTLTAGTIRETSAVLGGSIANAAALGNDIITERGYYWSTNSALSSSNLGVGTKVTISGTQSAAGNFSGTKSGLTAGTTYYFLAYAKNGYGTGYCSVQNFTTLSTYTVTVTAGAGGSASPSSVTAGQYLVSGTITASANTGYTFYNWTKTSGSGTVTFTNANAASTTLKSTSTATVRANFVDMWNVKGSWDSWAAYEPMTATGVSNTYSATKTLAAKTEYHIKVVKRADNNSSNDKWYGVNGGTTVTRASGSVTGLEENGGETEYITFTTDAAGDYTITYLYNASVGSMKVTVDYPTAYTMTFAPKTFLNGSSTGTTSTTGGTLTAKDQTNASLSTGDKVKNGGTATFTATKNTGYTFNGFFKNEVCTTAYAAGTGVVISDNVMTLDIDADKSVYAKFSENMTTVNLVASPTGKGTFTSGGGAVTSVSAGVTTHPTVTAVPASGYRVNTSATVWSESSDYITISATNAASTTITGSGTSGNSATLTATFTPNVYTITLNDNSGSGGVGSATVTFDADNFAFASSFVAPERTGYIFQGYFNASDMAYGEKLIDVDGTWLSDEYEYYIDEDGNWVYPNNYTLYAGWTPITYTVTYHANGGSAKDGQTDPTVTNWTYDVAQYISVPSLYFDAPTKYTLFSDDSKYWNDSEHGDGTDYAWGERSNLTSTDGDNIDLYAQWYTQVTLDKNHVDASTNGSMRVRYNQHVTYQMILPTRVGYHRSGFYTASEDGTKAFEADGTMVSGDVSGYIDDGYWIHTFASSSDPAPTFYTYWEENHYDLTFDGNDCAVYVGEATGSKASMANVEYETYVDITAGTLAREGYTFAGWSKTPCATSATYMGDTWRRISYVDGDDVTLYAVWTPKTYTISFNALNHGWCSTSSSSIKMGDNYDLPNAYGNSGYEFVGWYTRPEGGTLVTEETQMVTASDHTLYAHYEKKERVYFKNTLGWESVYVTWDATWNYNSQDKGAGAKDKTQELMSHIYGTDIWYKDIPAAIISSWKGNIAFTNMAMANYEWFDEGQAVYRRDFDSDATMFVPTPNDPYKYTKNTHDSKPGTVYYSTNMEVDKDGEEKITNYRYMNGYWVRYEELQSGYTVKGSWAWDDDHYVERHSLNDSTYVFTIRNLAANKEYWFNLYKHCTTSNNYSSVFKPNADMTSASAENVVFSAQYAEGDDRKMHTTVAGDYTFKFVFSRLGEIRLTIEYPLAVNDYRVVYSYTKGGAQTFASEYIKAKADAVDTISMFIHSADSATARSLYIQKCTGITAGVPTWNTTYSAITLPSETASGKTSGVYNFRIAQNGSAAAIGESIGKYEGNYYIRTDSAAGGWDFYKEYPANQMTYSEYSLSQTLSAPYSHYYCQYIGNTATDISYTIATDYSPAICPIQEGDATIGVGNKTLPSGKPASVRFTWNEETNGTFRSYLKSAQGDGNTRYLLIHGADDDMIFNSAGAVIADSVGKSMYANELLFKDTENWVYELAIKAKPGAQVSIIAQYDGTDRYLVGGAETWETIISGGTSSTKYDIAAVYDFKTNRLITTWIPSGTISEQLEQVDVLIERHNQDGATTITFGKAAVDKEAGSISAKRVIGALRFEYDELVGRVARWTADTRAKMMFFVSFPFDVNVSDIFGLNTNYGEAFIVQGYNGAKRAEKGFFKGDGTDTFWETLPVDTVMHAGVGYVVTLDNDYFNGDIGHIWDNKHSGDHVYMYFPSANDPSSPIVINSDDKTIKVPSHICKINRTFNGGKLNHKYTDSNWNLMGVPIFQNHTGDATEGTPGAIFTASKEPSDTTGYADPKNPAFGYFYVWHTDKTYTIQSAVDFVFKPMHSYMVQYAGDVKFTCAEPVAPSLAPRRTAMKENYNIELQVLNNSGDMLNHTYVELRENAVDSFALNEDIYMMSSNKAVSVYTFAGTYDVAANVLSIGSHIVPVGVIVKQAGTYTFTMPSNFSGTVTLVDTYAQTRTNLNIEDYEVSLPKGTDEERFYLEINISNVPTAIDGVGADNSSLKDGNAHKFIMNDMLYILKDGVLYDARGARVK